MFAESKTYQSERVGTISEPNSRWTMYVTESSFAFKVTVTGQIHFILIGIRQLTMFYYVIVHP